MKKRIGMVALGLAFVLAAGPAWAEMLTGMVQHIDPARGQLTLLRSEDQKQVTVSVKDATSLGQLRTGVNVTMDANKKLFGGYEAETVTPAPISSADIPEAKAAAAAA